MKGAPGQPSQYTEVFGVAHGEHHTTRRPIRCDRGRAVCRHAFRQRRGARGDQRAENLDAHVEA
eukprot:6366419-Prymnesium_polylepis.2